MYSPAPQSAQPEPAPPPGWFKSLLIHLAGADPRVFPHLPPTEASDYAKLGFTVLIPFALALGAGSFTVYTIQEDKSLGVSVLFGVIWAAMILGLDVAVMSQLIKRQAVKAPEGPRRAFAPASAPAAQLPPPSGKRRTILALLRILIAGTLGLVMSHCLVLAMFKGRVQHQMETARSHQREEIETVMRPKLESLVKELSAAQSVGSIAKGESFLAAFESWKAASGQRPDPVDKNATSSSPGDSVSEAMKPYEVQIKQLADEARKIRERRDTLQAELDSINEEMRSARKMRREEWDGVKGSAYTWLTDAFKSTMPAVTSGIKGEGSRVSGIDTAIKDAETIIENRQRAITAENEKLQKAEGAVSSATEARNKQMADLLANSTEETQAKAREYENSRRSAETAARDSLKQQIERLEIDLRAVRAERDAKLGPVTGSSYDLLEQTEALHDLAFGRNLEPGNRTKAGAVLGLIILVLICLMLIDLTPLLMKLSREPGPYDYFVSAREQFGNFASPIASPSHGIPQQPSQPYRGRENFRPSDTPRPPKR